MRAVAIFSSRSQQEKQTSVLFRRSQCFFNINPLNIWLLGYYLKSTQNGAVVQVYSSDALFIFTCSPKKGGVASGFKQVVTNEANQKRLLHVKGRRNIKAKEVDMKWDSFNTDDCFIIVLGEVIYKRDQIPKICSRESIQASGVAKLYFHIFFPPPPSPEHLPLVRLKLQSFWTPEDNWAGHRHQGQRAEGPR